MMIIFFSPPLRSFNQGTPAEVIINDRYFILLEEEKTVGVEDLLEVFVLFWEQAW